MRGVLNLGQTWLWTPTASCFASLPTATSGSCCFLRASFHALSGSGESLHHFKRWRDVVHHQDAPADSLRRQNHGGTRRLIVRCLNRLMLEPSEVSIDTNGSLSARLGATDVRAAHVRKVLKADDGECVRVGIVDAGLTDVAKVSWNEPQEALPEDAPPPEGIPPLVSVRKEGGRKGVDKLKDLVLDLGSSQYLLERVPQERRPKVALMLALPRPLQLERILPMVSSFGVSTLVLSTAKKVEKMYFGSHMFRQDNDIMRQKLVEGLAQSGHTVLPDVVVARRLKVFLEDDLERLFPKDRWARVVAHPTRLFASQEQQPTNDGVVAKAGRTCGGEQAEGAEGVGGYGRECEGVLPSAIRFAEVQPPEGCDPAEAGVLVTVGPEGGWDEPYELELLHSFGFQAVTLGSRVLRSDVAVCALLALAHAWVDERDAGRLSASPSSYA